MYTIKRLGYSCNTDLYNNDFQIGGIGNPTELHKCSETLKYYWKRIEIINLFKRIIPFIVRLDKTKEKNGSELI